MRTAHPASRGTARRLLIAVVTAVSGVSLVGAAATSAQVRTAAPGPGAMTVTTTLPSICGNATPTGGAALRHLIVIFMENESADRIIGNAQAPYQSQLAKQCGQATQLYGITHPSLPNYVAMHDGEMLPALESDCQPNPRKNTCVSNLDNIFNQLQQSGQTWKNYAEDMTTNCQLNGAGTYAPRHNPAVYFTDLTVPDASGATACSSNDVIMGDLHTRTGAFYTALRNGTLPAYSVVSPNLIDDGHNSSATRGDTYLSKLIPVITKSPNYQSGHTAIVITYDEGVGKDAENGEDCTNATKDRAGRQPSCHIPFIVISPYTAAGTTFTHFCTLYCFTRTIEGLYGLPLLGHAADTGTQDMQAAFNLSPGHQRTSAR